jgi:hypothetical protein
MPLFPFVWQYSNQPIEQLAADIAELSVNTAEYIPVSTGTSLTDSPLKVELVAGQTVLTSYRNGLWDGIQIAPAKYEFGALQVGAGAGNVTRLRIDDLGAAAAFSASYPNFVQFGVNGVSQAIIADGLDTTTAGATSGKYLRVKIGNTNYKVELLADA